MVAHLMSVVCFTACLKHTVSVVHQRNDHCYWRTVNMEEGTGLFFIKYFLNCIVSLILYCGF